MTVVLGSPPHQHDPGTISSTTSVCVPLQNLQSRNIVNPATMVGRAKLRSQFDLVSEVGTTRMLMGPDIGPHTCMHACTLSHVSTRKVDLTAIVPS